MLIDLRRLRRGVRKLLVSPAAVALAALGLVTCGAGTAWAVEPATPLGIGTTADIVAGVNTPDNQVF